MPYITENTRIPFKRALDRMPLIASKGELEFCIFSLLKQYMQGKEYNYSNLHDTTYAAVHAGEEFKRRYLDERENFAREKNGDIL